MTQEKNYFAFISYKSEDVEWAVWLQHELEHYHLPTSFNGRTDVRHDLRPVFRDTDELSAGNLPEQIKQALDNSQNLIVICSPQAAKSPWVNQEVKSFISLGRIDRIFPFIVDGDSPSDFFPPDLLNLPKDKERLGGDVSKNGRDAAFVKVVAGMLGVGFDSLWNRYEKEKAEEERIQREQRDNLLRIQSRFLSEKAINLVEEGDSYTARLIALEALPNELEKPNRPYVIEAEIALRKAYQNDNIKLEGHIGGVTTISLSPDGNILASASLDNFIRLWDVRTGKCLFKLEKPSIRVGKFKFDVLDGLVDEIDYMGFNSVSFSPDGNYLVSAGRDSSIYVWNLSTQDCITKIYNFDIHYGVNCVKFSPDGKFIISGGEYLREEYESIPGFSVWDSKTGNFLFSKDTKGTVYDMCISNDNKQIATIGYNQIHIWDSQTFDLLACLKYRIRRTDLCCRRRIAFSPKGDLIATSSDDTIRIWKIETGTLIRSIKTYNVEIMSLAFSPDGLYIFSGGKDSIIHMWDIESGKCDNKMKRHTGAVNTIAISPNGKYVSSGSEDHTIRLSDLTSDKAIKTFTIPSDIDKTGELKYDIQDGYRLVVKSKDCFDVICAQSDQVFKTMSVKHNSPDILKCHNADIDTKVTYNIDSNSIIIQNDRNGLYYSLENPLLIEIDFAVFSHNGKNLITLSYGKDICLFKDLPQTEEELETFEENHYYLKGHTNIVRCASFSPNGKYIVSASEDMTIRIWDIQSCSCIQIFNTNDDFIDCVDFTPDGKYIISINYNNVVRIWRFYSLQELIDETVIRFKTRQLTMVERKKYYLE